MPGKKRKPARRPKAVSPRSGRGNRPATGAGPRAEVEAALRESEERLRRERDLLQRALATPLVGIIILGPGGERVFVNDCAVARTGYTREEYLALPLARFALPEDFQEDLEVLRRMVAGEVDHESRVRRFVRKDGTTYWASTSVHCARAPDGSVTNLYYFVTDLSDLKVTEAALKASEQRFRTVVESSLEGITVLDVGSGRYSFVSPAQAAMTGFSVEELLALSASEVLDRVHPEDRSIPAEQLAAIESGGSEGSNVEYRWKVRSGEYRWLSDSRKAVRDADGRVVAVVGVAFDVTDRRRAEESLRESERWLRMSQEIARIGHYLFDVQADHWTSSATLNAIFGIDEAFPRAWRASRSSIEARGSTRPSSTASSIRSSPPARPVPTGVRGSASRSGRPSWPRTRGRSPWRASPARVPRSGWSCPSRLPGRELRRQDVTQGQEMAWRAPVVYTGGRGGGR